MVITENKATRVTVLAEDPGYGDQYSTATMEEGRKKYSAGFDFHFLRLLRSSALQRFCFWLRPRRIVFTLAHGAAGLWQSSPEWLARYR